MKEMYLILSPDCERWVPYIAYCCVRGPWPSDHVWIQRWKAAVRQRSVGAIHMENLPTAYVDGYAKARTVDREGADNYVRHTTIGDPVLDPIMEELSSMRPPICTASSRPE